MLIELNSAVVWIVSTRPLISKSFSPCINRLVTVSKAPMPIVITVTFMFHSFFSVFKQGLGIYLSFCFPSVFTLWSVGTAKSTFRPVLFFFCLVVGPRLGDPFVSLNPKEFRASHFLRPILGYAYTICSYGQILISCTILSGSPSPRSRV